MGANSGKLAAVPKWQIFLACIGVSGALMIQTGQIKTLWRYCIFYRILERRRVSCRISTVPTMVILIMFFVLRARHLMGVSTS